MTPDLDLRAPSALFIDGQWQASAGDQSLDTFCSATGDRTGSVPDATADDVDRAVRAARQAYDEVWSTVTAEARYELLMEMAERILEHEDRLRTIEVVDSGSAVRSIGGDPETAALFLRMYAGFARQLRGKTVNLFPDRLIYTHRDPYGVVAHLVPFNRPLRFVAHAVGVALAAGNTTVLKVSEYTPLSALEFAEIMREIVPPGVINIVTGGPRAGSALVDHPMIDKVHFRGSVATGRAVGAKCAARDLPYTLELGGKNPFVVFADADVDAAVRGAFGGLNLGFQGQSCSSATRLLVHQDVYEEFRAGLVERFAKVKVGLPWEEETDEGAIVSQPQYERVLSHIQSGHDQGARALVGGGPVQDPELSGGLFVQPTVFEVDDPTIRITTEEIFGPVTTLIRFKEEDEALAIANSVEYGHSGSVWTQNLARAHRVAGRLQSGVVWVNEHLPRPDGMPFGPRKASGIGKEHAIEEIDYYSQEKTVMVNLEESQRG